ncbi:MAG: ABC transporter ATP-binding protein [Ruminococcaceae bacterium]|nr:ABC transporter ATP-binding protein [Oscillospiraceae bacterium]
MILQLEHIYKNYSRGKNSVPVLKDICLQVEKGEYLAIMGPSGSGKTTLMNLIGCLDVASEGSYLLDGQDIGAMDDNALADIRNKYIGFVFQNFYLLPKMTALDNVALPLLYAGVPQKQRRERAAEALKSVGLEDRMNFMPNQLSGGQCQRVAIARAIVTNPSLLLADEPTGALDTTSGNQIMDIFHSLSENGMTIIMITHEQAVAERANKIYRILDGCLITDMEGGSGDGES